MSRVHASYAVDDLRVNPGGRASVYTGGQDVRLTWRVVRPFGGGYGEAPYDSAPYGGVEDGDLRGSLVQVWFGRLGGGVAPFVLVREVRVLGNLFVYRRIDNRMDAARYGLPFQAAIKFVVRPLTARGVGTAAETITDTTTVRAAHEPALGDLYDVDETGVADGDVLTYDAATDRWVPAASSGGPGSVALDDLTDVAITTPASGASLIYNGAGWVDGPVDLAGADSVSGTLPIANGGTDATNVADARTNLDVPSNARVDSLYWLSR